MRSKGVTLVSIIDDLNRKLDRLMMQPDNADLYNAIGTILCRLKDWDNAERYLARAYALSPPDRDILCNYTVALYRKQKYGEAVSVCRMGLELAPQDPGFLQKLADIYYLQGAYEEAEKTYRILHTASDKVGS